MFLFSLCSVSPWSLTPAPCWSTAWPSAWRPLTSCSTWAQRRSAGEEEHVLIFYISSSSSEAHLGIHIRGDTFRPRQFLTIWTFFTSLTRTNLLSASLPPSVIKAGFVFEAAEHSIDYIFQSLSVMCCVAVALDRTDSHASWSTCWPRGGESPNRVRFFLLLWRCPSSLTQCVFSLHSYYPLYPPVEEVNMDYEKYQSFGQMPLTPDVLIIPSELRYFVKVQNCFRYPDIRLYVVLHFGYRCILTCHKG